MASFTLRPWYRCHWPSWLIGVVVIAGLLARQFEEQAVSGMTNFGIGTIWSDFGWPLAHVHVIQSRQIGTPPYLVFEADYEWHGWHMVLNGMFGALLVVAAVFVTETWTRRERRFQFGIRTILATTAMTAGLISLSREWELPYRDIDFESFHLSWSLVSLDDLVHPLRWPGLFAIACALFAAAWLLLLAADRTWQWFWKPSSPSSP